MVPLSDDAGGGSSRAWLAWLAGAVLGPGKLHLGGLTEITSRPTDTMAAMLVPPPRPRGGRPSWGKVFSTVRVREQGTEGEGAHSNKVSHFTRRDGWLGGYESPLCRYRRKVVASEARCRAVVRVNERA